MDTMTYDYTKPTLSTKGQRMRDILADYIALISQRLPDDVTAKLEELSKIEVDPLQKLVYDTMMENQLLANKLVAKIPVRYNSSLSAARSSHY